MDGRFRRTFFFFTFGLLTREFTIWAAIGASNFYSLWLQWQDLGMQLTQQAKDGYM
jgi:hypothetical protein